MGVILYAMACFSYPFGHDGDARHGGDKVAVVYRRIREGTAPLTGHLAYESYTHPCAPTRVRPRRFA